MACASVPYVTCCNSLCMTPISTCCPFVQFCVTVLRATCVHACLEVTISRVFSGAKQYSIKHYGVCGVDVLVQTYGDMLT